MASTFTICGVDYSPTFKKAACGKPPCLTLTHVSVSSVTTEIEAEYECGGCNYAIFNFGNPLACTDAEAPGGPCHNVARIRVEWSCICGPGWYCVRDSGSGGACHPVELLDTDDCTGLDICSGPYATRNDAILNCLPVGTSCSDPGGEIAFEFWAEPELTANTTRYYHVNIDTDIDGTTFYALLYELATASSDNILTIRASSDGCVGGDIIASHTFANDFAGGPGGSTCFGPLTVPEGTNCICIEVSNRANAIGASTTPVYVAISKESDCGV